MPPGRKVPWGEVDRSNPDVPPWDPGRVEEGPVDDQLYAMDDDGRPLVDLDAQGLPSSQDSQLFDLDEMGQAIKPLTPVAPLPEGGDVMTGMGDYAAGAGAIRAIPRAILKSGADLAVGAARFIPEGLLQAGSLVKQMATGGGLEGFARESAAISKKAEEIQSSIIDTSKLLKTEQEAQLADVMQGMTFGLPGATGEGAVENYIRQSEAAGSPLDPYIMTTLRTAPEAAFLGYLARKPIKSVAKGAGEGFGKAVGKIEPNLPPGWLEHIKTIQQYSRQDIIDHLSGRRTTRLGNADPALEAELLRIKGSTSPEAWGAYIRELSGMSLEQVSPTWLGSLVFGRKPGQPYWKEQRKARAEAPTAPGEAPPPPGAAPTPPPGPEAPPGATTPPGAPIPNEWEVKFSADAEKAFKSEKVAQNRAKRYTENGIRARVEKQADGTFRIVREEPAGLRESPTTVNQPPREAAPPPPPPGAEPPPEPPKAGPTAPPEPEVAPMRFEAREQKTPGRKPTWVVFDVQKGVPVAYEANEMAARSRAGIFNDYPPSEAAGAPRPPGRMESPVMAEQIRKKQEFQDLLNRSRTAPAEPPPPPPAGAAPPEPPVPPEIRKEPAKPPERRAKVRAERSAYPEGEVPDVATVERDIQSVQEALNEIREHYARIKDTAPPMERSRVYDRIKDYEESLNKLAAREKELKSGAPPPPAAGKGAPTGEKEGPRYNTGQPVEISVKGKDGKYTWRPATILATNHPRYIVTDEEGKDVNLTADKIRTPDKTDQKMAGSVPPVPEEIRKDVPGDLRAYDVDEPEYTYEKDEKTGKWFIYADGAEIAGPYDRDPRIVLSSKTRDKHPVPEEIRRETPEEAARKKEKKVRKAKAVEREFPIDSKVTVAVEGTAGTDRKAKIMHGTVRAIGKVKGDLGSREDGTDSQVGDLWIEMEGQFKGRGKNRMPVYKVFPSGLLQKGWLESRISRGKSEELPVTEEAPKEKKEASPISRVRKAGGIKLTPDIEGEVRNVASKKEGGTTGFMVQMLFRRRERNPARFKKAMSWDEWVTTFAQDGQIRADATIDELLDYLLENKVRGRSVEDEEFEEAYGKSQAREDEKYGTKLVDVDDLDIGDTFFMRGEKFTVISEKDDGTLVIKDGQQMELDPDVNVAIDGGKEGITKKAQQGGEAPAGPTAEDTEEIAEEFEEAEDSRPDGEVHHIFDPPKKSEIVRLQDKVKQYVAGKGWMKPEEAKAEIEKWRENARKQGEEIRGENQDKVVLSLFDLTGEWARPWFEAGYNVFTFDIQNDPEMEDINKFSAQFLNEDWGAFGGNIYAVLSANPCTDFAVSGARHFAMKDADGRTVESVDLVKQTLATIEYLRPAIWAIENPVGRIEKLTGLPPWRLSFDPNHVGHPYTKKTLIWGRFNADLPIAPVEPTEGSKMWAKYGGKSQQTKNARAETPEGFAYAFFQANNFHDNMKMGMSYKYDRLDPEIIGKAVDAGLKEKEIDELVEDFYYQELDDQAAEKALLDAIESRKPKPPVPKPPPAEEEYKGPELHKNMEVSSKPISETRDAVFHAPVEVIMPDGKRKRGWVTGSSYRSEKYSRKEKKYIVSPTAHSLEFPDGTKLSQYDETKIYRLYRQDTPEEKAAQNKLEQEGYEKGVRGTKFYKELKAEADAGKKISWDSIKAKYPDMAEDTINTLSDLLRKDGVEVAESVVPEFLRKGGKQQTIKGVKQKGFTLTAEVGPKEEFKPAPEDTTGSMFGPEATKKYRVGEEVEFLSVGGDALQEGWHTGTFMGVDPQSGDFLIRPVDRVRFPNRIEKRGSAAVRPHKIPKPSKEQQAEQTRKMDEKLEKEAREREEKAAAKAKAKKEAEGEQQELMSEHQVTIVAGDLVRDVVVWLSQETKDIDFSDDWLVDMLPDQLGYDFEDPNGEKIAREISRQLKEGGWVKQTRKTGMGETFYELTEDAKTAAKDELSRPKKKKPTKAEREYEERMNRIREIYTPGNLIFVDYWRSYDKVLEFDENKFGEGMWGVKVQLSDKEGNPLEPPRWHSTPPDKDKIVRKAGSDETLFAGFPLFDPEVWRRAFPNGLPDVLKDFLERHRLKEGAKRDDLNWFNDVVNTPFYIFGEKHPEGRPVFERARQGFQERSNIADKLADALVPFLELDLEEQKRLNTVLVRGRYRRKVYTGAELDNMGLDDRQKAGYRAVQKTMDMALDFLQDAIVYRLTDGRIPNASELSIDMLEDLLDQLYTTPGTTTGQGNMFGPTDRLDEAKVEYILRTIRRIREAKRQGYVPFSRFGDVAFGFRRVGPNGQPGDYIWWEMAESRGKAADRYSELYERFRRGIEAGRILPVEPKEMGKPWKRELINSIGPFEVGIVLEMAGLDTGTNDAFKTLIDTLIKKQGFKSHFFEAKDTPGFTMDLQRALADYVIGISGHIARMKMIPDMDKLAIPAFRHKPKLAEYYRAWRDYIVSPQEEFQGLRSALFVAYLGLNPKSALVNLTQTFVGTFPWLTQFVSEQRAAAEISRAFKDMTAALGEDEHGQHGIVVDRMPADVRDELRRALDEGIISDQILIELTAQAKKPPILRKLGSVKQRSAYYAGWLFSRAEMANRVVAMVAALRIHRSLTQQHTAFGAGGGTPPPPEPPPPGMSTFPSKGRGRRGWITFNQDAYDFGKRAVDESQFIYSKLNRPRMFRKWGAFLGVFRTFTLGFIEFLARMWRVAPRSVVNAMVMLWFFAGTLGLPFGQNIKDLLEGLLGTITHKTYDLERSMREWAHDVFGSTKPAEVVLRGPWRLLTGMDLARSVGQGDTIPGIGAVTGDYVQDVIGVPADIYKRGVRGKEALQRGDPERAMEVFMPEFIRNPVVAARWAREGIVNYRGETVLTKDQVTKFDIAMKAIGITPTKVSMAYELIDARYKLKESTRRAEQDIAIQVTNLIRKGKYKEAAEVIEKNIDLVSEESINEKLEGVYIPLEYQGLKRMPSKKRPDFMDLNKIYGPGGRDQ